MTYNTRIQLKSDIEDNWKKVNSTFIPLSGELIVYSPDNTHSYCRVKIGDGATTIGSLPFIDSGTINGEEVEIAKFEDFAHFSTPGSPDKLYIDLSTNVIYHYDSHSGYTQLSNFTFTITKTEVTKVSVWRPGIMTDCKVENNKLILTNGTLPELTYYNTQVVNSVTKE